jgi:hypothetical protein
VQRLVGHGSERMAGLCNRQRLLSQSELRTGLCLPSVAAACAHAASPCARSSTSSLVVSAGKPQPDAAGCTAAGIGNPFFVATRPPMQVIPYR